MKVTILKKLLLGAGLCSWFYPSSMYAADARVCASNTIKIGTRVHVVNADKPWRDSHCVIIGTGPFIKGRILDVSPQVRDDLDMGGTTHVTIYPEGR